MNLIIKIADVTVPIFDIVALLVIVPAVFILCFGRRDTLSQQVRLMTAGILGLLFFHNLSNALEWLKITSALDVYEDYSELLQPVAYFFTLFLFAQERGVNELRESEKRFRAIFEQAAVGVAQIVSRTGKFSRINQKFADIAGCTVEDMEQLSFDEITHPDDLRENQDKMQSLLVGEIPEFSMEKRILHKDGSVVWVNLTVSPMWTVGEDPDYHITVIEDITDRKQAEEELLAAEQQLRTSNQQLTAGEQQLKAANQQLIAREQELVSSNRQLRTNELEREELLKTLTAKNKELQSVVYIASHDLKSPLINIQGFSSVLVESCQQVIKVINDLDIKGEAVDRILSLTEGDIPESLNFISASASKMGVLLDGLLQVSRLGTAVIKIRKLNMNNILNNICRSMEFQIKKADVKVSIDDLPSCEGDAEMINQLFSNLLGNALKYLDPERKGKIHITGTVENSQSIYCVEDNGVGIAPEHQPKIFELFHRLNPNDSVGGEGLGLTIVTRILDRNNGTIRVESEPGTGSKFFVTLPTG